MENQISIAEQILNKHYPEERTVFRENILKAMDEYMKWMSKEFMEMRLQDVDTISELTRQIRAYETTVSNLKFRLQADVPDGPNSLIDKTYGL